MGPEHSLWGGMGLFPMLSPILILGLLIAFLFLLFGRRTSGSFREGSARSHRDDGGSDGSALEILARRYASGEIGREEFEQMKKDILNSGASR